MSYKSALKQATTVLSNGAPEAARASRIPFRFRLLLWVKVVLTVSVLGLLIFTIHPEEIMRAVRGARYPLVLASLALVIPALSLRALKWGYLLRQVKPTVRAGEVWATLLVGATFAVVTPGQVGESGAPFSSPGVPAWN